ncbi:hypothetical protein [Paenibacillus sp. SI8]|uniref:hypothetical protein n=1 Tax=unclassified Paenibacillus TaxID=185978 RepID=UPI003467094A
MYTNNFNNFGSSSFGSQNSQGAQGNQGYQGIQSITSQYQGGQKQYQPVGYVQSYYGQNTAQTNQSQNQSYGQTVAPDAFHTANYRGNQAGHDFYRSESIAPTQQQTSFQSGYSTYSNNNNTNNNNYFKNQFGAAQSQQPIFSSNQQQYGATQFGGSVQTNQSYTQQTVSPNAYHTANYRGNQYNQNTGI